MAKRSYHQYCGIAAAQDVLGERWTLLILRNLLLGPQRFSDLLNGLPGIGTGLLTERLKHLEEAEVVTRATLPPPAASSVYRLTPRGEELRPLLLGLARWGTTYLGDPDDLYHSPDLLALGLQARFDPDRATDADGAYALRIDNRRYRVDLADGTITVRTAEVDNPRAWITTDSATLIALDSGSLTLAGALTCKSLTVTGDTTVIPALVSAFGL